MSDELFDTPRRKALAAMVADDEALGLYDDSKVVSLSVERNKREQPDAEFIRKDDFGRPLYAFLFSYEMDENTWAMQLWAYDFEDAQKRCEAIRASLKLDGQAFTTVPA